MYQRKYTALLYIGDNLKNDVEFTLTCIQKNTQSLNIINKNMDDKIKKWTDEYNTLEEKSKNIKAPILYAKLQIPINFKLKLEIQNNRGGLSK